MKCSLSQPDKDYLKTPEKYKAFFMFQYRGQDDWLETTLERYFSERSWRLFNAGKEGGTGTKFCNICRYALASDFGLASLTPLNHNVFQEIGLMQGFQKPVLYLLNPNLKKTLPFDIDDQIYIEHKDEKTLVKGLDNKIPLLLDKVQLISGFESEKIELIRNKVKELSADANKLLKKLVLEGPFNIRQNDFQHFIHNLLGFDSKFINELRDHNFIVLELGSGGSGPIYFYKFNESHRKYLEEILWD